MNWRILIFLLILCQSCAVHKKSRQIDDLIKHEMKSQGIPGISATIYKQGKKVHSKGYGYADVEKQISVNPSRSKFRIASISKTMTSALLSRLDKAGYFHLDSSVYVYLDSFPNKKYDFTVRQLGGHLAGIRSYKDNEWWSNKAYNNVAHSMNIFKNDPLINKPGTAYKYSTYGYNLLSFVIERGMARQNADSNYVSLITDSLFNLMDMKSTNHSMKDRFYSELNSTGFYKIEEGKVIPEREVDLSNKWAGGGFLSSSEDVAQFAYKYWFTDYVSDSIRHEYTKTNYLNNGEATNYGVGWVIKEGPKGHTWYGHAGGGVGGVSIMMVYPKEEIVIVLLCNASNAKIKTLYESVAKVMLED